MRTPADTRQIQHIEPDARQGSALIMLDPAGLVQTWNQGAERLFAYQETEIIGEAYTRFYLPADRAAGVPEQYLRHAQHLGHSTAQHWLLRCDGARFWARITLIALPNSQDSLPGFSLLIHDLTEQHERELTLRAGEERYRKMVEAREHAEHTITYQLEMLHALYAEAYSLTTALDAHHIAERVTRVCVESFGSQLAWMAMAEPDGAVHMLTCFPPDNGYPREIMVRWDDTPAGHGPMGRAIRTGEVVVISDIDDDPSFTLWRSHAAAHGFRSVAAVPLFSPEGPLGALNIYSDQHEFFSPERLALFQAFAHQATAAFINAQSFAALTQQREYMRELAVRLGEAEEAERRVLARELHDRVGANLAALKLNVHLVRAQLAANPAAPVAARLDDSLKLISEVMSHVRNVMMELRPAVLDDYGLLAALRWLAEDMLHRANLAATVGGVEPEPRLPSVTQTALFRIAQEALNNVLKHAHATHVTIQLTADAGMVYLTIADNGVGFEPQATQRSATGGFGMTTMHERAQVIGGTTRIESTPGQGGRVIVAVPR